MLPPGRWLFMSNNFLETSLVERALEESSARWQAHLHESPSWSAEPMTWSQWITEIVQRSHHPSGPLGTPSCSNWQRKLVCLRHILHLLLFFSPVCPQWSVGSKPHHASGSSGPFSVGSVSSCVNAQPFSFICLGISRLSWGFPGGV